ncbi:MAG: hypothetical protein U0984_10080 [Prosthecobacter sp.]|nr:hypothetical protein [Prosthecobacter sp.]
MDAITGILPWPLESLKKEAALGEIEKSIEADPPAPGTVIEIGPQITLRELAELVGRQWYEIIPTLIVLDTVVDGPDHVLSFELAGRIASGYGYEVWRVG